MATVDLVASTVLNTAASLMNDTARTVYTYTAMLPYLRIAMNELQEKYELNAIPVTEITTSNPISVPAGATTIEFNAVAPNPALPDDFIEPQELWERNTGIDPYIPMTKKEYLPRYYEGVETNRLVWFTWQSNKINFLPSNADNEVKIDYIRALFLTVADETTQINVINAQTFLEFRTAGLLAEFIERNITSANSLNAQALLAMDRALGIGAKGKQSIQTRRLPFRTGWKRRSGGWR